MKEQQEKAQEQGKTSNRYKDKKVNGQLAETGYRITAINRIGEEGNMESVMDKDILED